VAEQGLEFLPELIRIVVNNAMQVEHQKYLGVGPYGALHGPSGTRQWFQAQNDHNPDSTDHL
jgi:hypothetical protein